MFLLSFDAKKTYNLKTFLNTVVKVEPPRVSKWIPQFKSCQGFNHTKNYCSKPPRCVKCAGKHSTEECNTSVNQKPKCVNFGEEHLANYRGCLVAKELQKLRNKQAFSSNSVPRQSTEAARIPAIRVNPSVSYAKVTKNTNNNSSKSDVLSQMLEKLNRQEEFNKLSLNKNLNLQNKNDGIN